MLVIKLQLYDVVYKGAKSCNVKFVNRYTVGCSDTFNVKNVDRPIHITYI